MPLAGVMSVANSFALYTFMVLGIFISVLIVFAVTKIKGYNKISTATFFVGWVVLLGLLLLFGYFNASIEMKKYYSS